MRPKANKQSFEDQLFALVFLAAIPSFLLALLCLWLLELSFAAVALISLFLLGKIILIAYYLRRRFSYQLRTLSSLLEAVSNDDFSLRGRVRLRNKKDVSDSLSELVQQINLLADTLMSQRLEVKENQLLLAKIINNIDIALLSIDQDNRVTNVNRAFCRLFGLEVDSLLNSSVTHLGIHGLLSASPDQPIEWQFPSMSGRFSVYSDTFIEEGKPHRLILISDVRMMLRAEQQQAWQKLIRVLGHEINNSLTPIASLSASLQKMVGQAEKTALSQQSLAVIQQRAAGLKKLVNNYKMLAKQAEPLLEPVDIIQLINNCCALFPNLKITIATKTEKLWLHIDRHQIEQVLINLINNAVESQALVGESADAAIEIITGSCNDQLSIAVLDQGTGISNPDNVFVPFYTTKPKGSGIGLAVSRQIIEAHGGELRLVNRNDVRGCRAEIVLPMKKKIAYS